MGNLYVILICATLLGWSGTLQAASLEATGRGDAEAMNKAMSKAEKKAVDRAVSKDASQEDKVLANDICAKKCKVCFDGYECDYKCAKNTCSK